MSAKYTHTVIPMAWCSECGKGECEHTDFANDSLIKSFIETKMAPPRKRKPRAEYPAWICSPCGRKYGRRECGISTWHEDDCGVCGQVTLVTEPRDYGGLKDGWQRERVK